MIRYWRSGRQGDADISSTTQPDASLSRRYVRSPNTLAACLAWVSLYFLAPPIAAQEHFPRKVPNGFTWGELAILPEYCKDTQGTIWDKHGNGGPESPHLPKWLALMGEDFLHVHHYCYGLRDLLRATSAGEGTPRGRRLLESAVNQFQYMIRNSQPTMPLMPEILLKQGEAQLKLGDSSAADASFARSRELKPDYWPAYVRWADFLIGLKLYSAALSLLKDGLAHAPDQPELVARVESIQRRAGGASSVTRAASSGG